MVEQVSDVITGWAAGVPFTAVPPAGAEPVAPLIVAWHMMDAPRSDAAFAAALPLAGVPSWRVYLGLPTVGRRPVEGAFEAAQADPMLRFVDPLVRQATSEFPAALAVLRERFPIADGPIGVVGGSLGATIALSVLARSTVPVSAAALINGAVRARSVIDLFSEMQQRPYPWPTEARAVAEHLDFVAHADLIAARDPQPALLVISGELDHPAFRQDAADLVDALHPRSTDPERVRLLTVPGLAHPLADEPGLDPAPQTVAARRVDEHVTGWFRKYLRGDTP